MAFIRKGESEAKFTKEQVFEKAGGPLSEKNVCDTARHFGFGNRASANQPIIK